MITLQSRTGVLVTKEDYAAGWLGHFHVDCWWEVIDAVYAAFAPETTAELGTDEGDVDRATDETGPVEDSWSDLPMPAREHLVFGVLDGEKLTIREITERLAETLPVRTCRGSQGEWTKAPIYDSEVRSVITRLFKDGQLTRQPERCGKTRVRYRYFLPPLAGPIVEIERALAESQGEAAS